MAPLSDLVEPHSKVVQASSQSGILRPDGERQIVFDDAEQRIRRGSRELMEKRFRLAAQDIKPLASGRGGCVASDRITVGGMRVGFMYREPPDNSHDSGWKFFSGDELQEFADNPSNFGIYDVNTIANYDPEIIPHLEAPAYSAFERDPSTGQFRLAEFPTQQLDS